jgi:adenine-specific DNA-methyltransferase
MPFLDWVNKNQAKETTRDVPYHLLKQEEVYGSGDENLVIQGDNLLALKALIPFYAGRVKCIFIDPPYNTQSAFEHYDDKLEHSQWLSMMYPRLVLLRDLLAEDGSIWVSIDDSEGHYLKVLMDEVFGRGNFVANVIWEKKYAPQNNAIWLSDSHDHIHVYARSKNTWRPNQLPRSDEMNARYKNLDDDPRGVWKPSDFTISLSGGQRGAQYAKTGVSENIYEIVTPSGRKLQPARGRCWGASPTRYAELLADNRIWFGPDGNNVPALKRFLTDVQDGVVAKTIWFRHEVGDNQDAKREVVAVNQHEVFGTPKPEKLIQRILDLATKPNDIVLDSFLGSGTTAAVAHKMGRRYIGIEMGEHARTHCIPRLQKVVEGEQGGISEAVNWKGGGGFRFCKLGEPAFDSHGRINTAVRFATLAAYVWHYETGEPGQQTFDQPLLGIEDGTAYYLLYNGILGDRRPASGNVLTHAVLDAIKEIFPHDGPKVIYGETTRLGAARLAAENITFKQIPYDVKMR